VYSIHKMYSYNHYDAVVWVYPYPRGNTAIVCFSKWVWVYPNPKPNIIEMRRSVQQNRGSGCGLTQTHEKETDIQAGKLEMCWRLSVVFFSLPSPFTYYSPTKMRFWREIGNSRRQDLGKSETSGTPGQQIQRLSW